MHKNMHAQSIDAPYQDESTRLRGGLQRMNPREDAEKAWLTNGADAGIPPRLVGVVGGKREKNRKRG